MFLCHPQLGAVSHFVLPGIEGGFQSNGMLLIVAIVGTTVTPWQLFFQQSNVVDKRITPRWIPYERADTVIGAGVVVIGAAAIMIATAYAFAGTPLHGDFTNALALAERDHEVRRTGRRRGLRDPAHRRVHRRCECGDALDVVRIRRHVRYQELAAPLMARSQALLCDVHGAGRARGGTRADPQCATRSDHHGGAGTRRRDAAECLPVSAASSATTAMCSVRG